MLLPFGIYHLKHIFDFRTEVQVTKTLDCGVDGAEYHWIQVNEDAVLNTSYNSSTIAQTAESLVEKFTTLNLSKRLQNALMNDACYATKGGLYDITKTPVTDSATQNRHAEFFYTIIDYPGESVLWHCAWGNDRAGLTSVLLLSALGVDKKSILNDYELKNVYYHPLISAIESELRLFDPINDDVVARM